MKRALVFLVLLVLLVLTPTKRIDSTPMRLERPKEILIKESPDWSSEQVGKVLCSEHNEPFIIIRSSLDSSEKKFVIMHEKVHASQLLSDCQGTFRLYNTNKVIRQKMEIEAYCADGLNRLKSGWQKATVVAYVRKALRKYHGLRPRQVNCSWF